MFIFVRTAGALAIHKLIAVLYGPAGTTIFSHFQNLISLFTQPVQDVAAQGLINAYPNQAYSQKNLYSTAIITLLLIFLLTGTILGLTSTFPDDIFQFSIYQWGLIILAILLICFQSFASAILIAQQKLKILTFIHFVQWIVMIGLLGYLQVPITNTLLYYALLLGFFTLLFFASIKEELMHLSVRSSLIDKKILTHFKQFLWMGLAVWISSKWTDFFIREYAMNLFGEKETGYWQAVVRISEAYRGLFLSFLFITFFPVISNLIANREADIKNYLKREMKQFFIISMLFLILVFISHSFILQLLYTNDYTVASSLFSFQIIGDFLAFLSFPLALFLMASLKTRAYILCEIVSASTYISCIYLGNKIGVEVLVLAHIIRFIFYFALVLIFTNKTLKIDKSSGNMSML